MPDTPEGLIEARQAREESEKRLTNVYGLIELFREMRQENHITEDVRRVIEKRIQESGR